MRTADHARTPHYRAITRNEEGERVYALHKMLWDIRRDTMLKARYLEDPDAVLDEYGIEGEWRDRMRVDGLQVAVRAGDQPVSTVLLRDPTRGRPCRILRANPWGEGLMSTTGKVVGAFMASHSPGITGWPERAEPKKRQAVEDAYTRGEAAAPGARTGCRRGCIGGALHQLPPRQPARVRHRDRRLLPRPGDRGDGPLRQCRAAPVPG